MHPTWQIVIVAFGVGMVIGVIAICYRLGKFFE
jgi:uncharacterized membrane-anchored protein YhcB (DUF1043 family)